MASNVISNFNTVKFSFDKNEEESEIQKHKDEMYLQIKNSFPEFKITEGMVESSVFLKPFYEGSASFPYQGKQITLKEREVTKGDKKYWFELKEISTVNPEEIKSIFEERKNNPKSKKALLEYIKENYLGYIIGDNYIYRHIIYNSAIHTYGTACYVTITKKENYLFEDSRNVVVVISNRTGEIIDYYEARGIDWENHTTPKGNGVDNYYPTIIENVN